MKTLKELDKYLGDLYLDSDHNRFTLNELNKIISVFLGLDVEFDKIETETDDFRLGLDLHLFSDKVLYVDIYYLLDSKDMLYITNHDLDSDNLLDENDYNQFITDSDQDLLSKNSAYAFYIDNIDKFDKLANVLLDYNKESLYGWFYSLIDEIKNVKQVDFPLGG